MNLNISNRKVKIVVTWGLLMVFLISMVSFGGSILDQKKAWEKIRWNEPKSWSERLLADNYILPKGWKEATKGVKEIMVMNCGSLRYDIATAMNMKRFEQLTGIKVKALPLSADLLQRKALATVVSRDSSPVGLNPQFISPFVAGEWVTSVDHMWPEEIQELYSPTLAEAVYWRGHWWGLPGTYITHLQLYRPSWLKKAGVTVPETWKEYYKVLKKVTEWARKNKGEEYYGIAFYAGTVDVQFVYRALLAAQGTRIYEDGKYQFTSQAGKNAFSWLVNVVKEGLAPKDVVNFSFGDTGRFFGLDKAAFNAEQVASYLTVYEAQYPKVGKDVAAFAPPKWSEETPGKYANAGTISTGRFLINKYADDEHKAAFMLFADYWRSLQAQRNEMIVEGNDSALTYLWDHLDEQIPKVDWEFADKVAQELNIEPRPHRTSAIDLPGIEAREAVAKNGIGVGVYPAGHTKVIDEFQQQFSKAALGEITIDQALENIQNLADMLS